MLNITIQPLEHQQLKPVEQGGDDEESQSHTSKLESVVQGEIGVPLV